MEMDTKKRDLLLRAGTFFMRNGLKGPNMGDVARELRISKKTLYKYVSDKRDLVRQAIEVLLEEDRKEIHEIISKDINAIDKVYLINMKVGMKLRTLQPSVMYDLKHFFPEADCAINQQHENFTYDIIRQIHRQGIKEGLFRADIDVEILAKINVLLIRAMFDEQRFPQEQYSFAEVHREISNYHLRGIVSPAGEDYINTLRKKIKDKEF